jgi:hypothetical protein
VQVLTRRVLNRALLERNLLLDRVAMPVPEAVEHLIGVQAQEPQEPYVGLHARLADFDPLEASDLLQSRALVRTLMMRRTVHLLTARDALGLRTLHDPMLRQRMRGTLRPFMPDVDEDELAAACEPLLAAQPQGLTEVGRAVGSRWPAVEPRVLGDAVSTLLPLVQVPPRGLWRTRGPARCTTIGAWLGAEPAAVGEPGAIPAHDLVLRYLRAFGPAATADIRAWSGLTGLPAVLKDLAPDLGTYRDERGRLLWDHSDGALPDPDQPAPPRFLPAFDNALLGYDDRTRVVADEHRGVSVAGARVLLVDGVVAGTWTDELDGERAVVTIRVLTSLGDMRSEQAVVAEAEQVAAFLHPDAGTHEVAITPR